MTHTMTLYYTVVTTCSQTTGSSAAITSDDTTEAVMDLFLPIISSDDKLYTSTIQYQVVIAISKSSKPATIATVIKGVDVVMTLLILYCPILAGDDGHTLFNLGHTVLFEILTFSAKFGTSELTSLLYFHKR